MSERGSIDRLLNYYTDEARWLAERWSLGPISARSIETDLEGRPRVVQVTCERAVITWRYGKGPIIERRPT